MQIITKVKLIADEGKVVTNGTNYGKIIFLAAGETAEGYFEITDAEYSTLLEGEGEDE